MKKSVKLRRKNHYLYLLRRIATIEIRLDLGQGKSSNEHHVYKYI